MWYDHESGDCAEVGSASIGMEAKLSCVGCVLSADGPVITDDGEVRSCNANTFEHVPGIYGNYLFKCNCKSSSYWCETDKSECEAVNLGCMSALSVSHP